MLCVMIYDYDSNAFWMVPLLWAKKWLRLREVTSATRMIIEKVVGYLCWHDFPILFLNSKIMDVEERSIGDYESMKRTCLLWHVLPQRLNFETPCPWLTDPWNDFPLMNHLDTISESRNGLSQHLNFERHALIFRTWRSFLRRNPDPAILWYRYWYRLPQVYGSWKVCPLLTGVLRSDPSLPILRISSPSQ